MGQSRDELRGLVEGYISDVMSGSRIVGELERLCVERHLRDLKRVEDGTAGTMRFDEDRAFHILEFTVRFVRHTKKKPWAGQRFRFNRNCAWEAFILWSLFGWVRRNDRKETVRRFRSVYISVARKNGKTMLAAIIACYMLLFDGESAAEVYFSATKKDQAAIGWKQTAGILRKMAKEDADFRERIRIVDSRYHIGDLDTSSICEALGRETNTQDGLGAHLGVCDELHEYRDRRPWDVIESGQGAGLEPMMLGITTAGSTRQGLCWDLDWDGQRILRQVIDDDSIFAFIARIDDGDDPHSEDALRKSNPNLGESVHMEDLLADSKKAKNNPAYLNEYRRKKCNAWTEADTAWLTVDQWNECEGDALDLDAMAGEPCYAAVDISSVSDLSCLGLVFPRPSGTFDFKLYSWIPSESVADRAQNDRVPYDVWAEHGWIELTDGALIDQDAVKERLIWLRDEKHIDVREVPVDPKEMWKLSSELEALEFTVVRMGQGYWLSGEMKETERMIRGRQLRHDGNPVARWALQNVSVQTNPQGRIKCVKGKDKHRKRIDPMTVLIMALGRAAVHVGPASIYETRGVIGG